MNNISTREAFGKALLDIGVKYNNIAVVDADISKSTNSNLFHYKYPDRSYNVGIAEQNMLGVAAGLASTGLKVFATTYAVFASMRALEQIRTFICYPKLDVKVIASHGGLQVSSDGVSHQGTEDIAIMRALPNMTVVHPADIVSTEKLFYSISEYNGPVYFRLMRNPVPVIYKDDEKFELGKGKILGEFEEAKCTIIATGLMVEKSLRASEMLKKDGILTRVVDMHTIKPIDKELIEDSAKKTGAVVTVEDHNIIGGLGSAVSEFLGENYPVPIVRIGLRDIFGESGEPELLFTEYKMNIKHIVEAVKRVISRKSQSL